MHKFSDLRPKQLQAIDFIKGGYESLVLADVGTGKTVITLTALFDLLRVCAINRVLVLAPKRVATDVWAQEFLEWDHLYRYRDFCGIGAGLCNAKRRKIIEDHSIKIVVLNYEQLIWLMQEFPQPPFDTLVCDEIDKLKDRTSQRFAGKKVKGQWLHKGMKVYSQQFETRIGLTGTPASNSLLDLWAQCYIVDGGRCLGRSFNKYQRGYFYPTDYSNKKWSVLPTYDKKIYDKIAPITFRIERDDSIPPVVELPPRWISMPDDTRKLYKKFERDLLILLDDEKISIESPDARAGYGRLREMASGFSYYTTQETKSKQAIWHFHHKFIELRNLISELQGQQLMIVYHFTEQLEMMKTLFSKNEFGYLGGGISDKQASLAINAWNTGAIKLLAMHPFSGGHGLNLQKSGAHHICMLTLPDSAGLNEQVIGRLRRKGNNAESIIVHRILTRGTIDEDRLAVVQGKIQTQQQLLDAMKARCEK